ncbi:hypothetical protein, partial [Staphylococcus simulans]|uniref:hypothetical protein n=1 Tax=Staphylococcus simulans TaxID=1286 RepID=UPI002DBE0C90
IRKVVAQRAENNQKIYKKDNFYIISIEIVFFSLIQELYVPDSIYNSCLILFIILSKSTGSSNSMILAFEPSLIVFMTSIGG